MSHNFFFTISRGFTGKVHLYPLRHKQHNLICFGLFWGFVVSYFLWCYQDRKLHANFGEPSAECRYPCPDLVVEDKLIIAENTQSFFCCLSGFREFSPFFHRRMWGKAALLHPLCRWAWGVIFPRSAEDEKLEFCSQVFPILDKFFPAKNPDFFLNLFTWPWSACTCDALELSACKWEGKKWF